MDYYKYLSYTTGFFVKPGNAVQQIFFGFRDRLFRYGVFTSLFANISVIMAGLILNPFQMGIGGGFIISHLIFSLIVHYLVFFVTLAIIFMFMHFVTDDIRIQEFAGLYLATEFPFFVMLPLALIFYVLPESLFFLYNLLTFIIFVLVLVLRVKAISVAAKLRDLKSFGLLLIPIGFMVLLGLSTFLYLSSVILNLLR